jgi:hypothetical protein
VQAKTIRLWHACPGHPWGAGAGVRSPPTPGTSGLGLFHSVHLQTSLTCGRCFRAVDAMSDEEPKLIGIGEEANHQIVHRRRFGKANGATYETLEALST